jgi:hypothetical protein
MITDVPHRALRELRKTHAEQPRVSRSDWHQDCKQKLKGENHPGTRTRGFGDQLSRSLRYIMAILLRSLREAAHTTSKRDV